MKVSVPAAATPLAVFAVKPPVDGVKYKHFAEPCSVPAAAFVGTSTTALPDLTLASVTVVVAEAAHVKVPMLALPTKALDIAFAIAARLEFAPWNIPSSA